MMTPNNDFYSSLEGRLRFGDIISNTFHLIPYFKSNFDDSDSIEITLYKPKYFSVLTPCCQIGKNDTLKNESVIIAPLHHISEHWLKIPYFNEDLTRINTLCERVKTILPRKFEALSPEEQQTILESPMIYPEANQFIYAPNQLLDVYRLNNGNDSGYYKVDFKNVCSIRIKEPRNYEKICQLSINTRNALRLKLSKFYGAIPIEDDD